MKSIRSFLSDTFSTNQFYKITGEASFKVVVDIKGEAPYSKALLSVQAVNDLENRIAIATNCRWFRRYKLAKGELKATGNTYQVSALDVGAEIIVEIEPAEEDEIGKATVVFGPIELDPATKIPLQGIMRSGGSTFVIDSISHSESHMKNPKTGSLILFKNSLKFCINESRSEFRVGLEENFDVIAQPGAKGILFCFVGREDELQDFIGGPAKIVCITASQNQRDILIMAIRCFQTKMNLEDSVIFDKVKQSLNGEALDFSNEENLDLATKNSSIMREVDYLYKNNSRLASENEKLESLVRNLEGEINRSVYCNHDINNL